MSDQLVAKLNEEDKRLKKKSLEIGTWTNEMASRLDAEEVEDDSQDFDEEELDEIFSPNAALPDNLTIVGNNVNGLE